MSPETPLWQEDEELPLLELLPVTRLDLIRYAGASGDYNPIHTIDEEARRAGLPGVIQHGMLTMAQMGRLLSPHLGDGWIARFQTRFRRMLFVGETLHISGVVSERTESEEGDRFTIRLTAKTADGRMIATGSIDFVQSMESES